MNPPGYTYRPRNPFARRAGVLLLVMAGLALLFGGSLLAAGAAYSKLMQDGAFAERVDTIRQQTQVEPQVLIIVCGSMLLAYAVVAGVIGMVVRGGHQVVIIVAMVLSVGVVLFGLLSVLVSIAGGDGGAIAPLLVVVGHGVVIKWLIDAIRFSFKSAVTFTAPPAYQPMQAYYTSPTQPGTLHAAASA